MKSILKRKIALTLLGSAILMTTGGVVLTAYSSKAKNNILENYSKMDDFSKKLNSEIDNLYELYSTNKINKKEYEDKINYVNSMNFVEETLKSENSQYSQALNNKNLQISIGAGMTLLGVTGCAVSSVGLGYIQKGLKREKKIKTIENFIEKLDSEDDLLNENL